METEILKINPHQELQPQLSRAVELLGGGNLVAFPTETVYGLGANGLDEKAVAKIFETKSRPQDNPLILHISRFSMLEDIAHFDESRYRFLTDRFWPGPLTLVLPKKSTVPDNVSLGLPTVAVRMPSHPVASALIHACGFPLAAPSANLSGRPSPTRAEMVYHDLKGRIPLILDGGPCAMGLESTVLDLSGEKPAILRPGAITREDILSIMPGLPEEKEESNAPRSPGMKYRHYKPDSRIILFQDPGEIPKILDEEKPDNPAVIGLDSISVDGVQSFHFPSAEELGKNLYSLFYELEKEGVDLILIEKIPMIGLGKTIMNRVLKAADRIV